MKKRVLIVDDTAIYRMAVKIALRGDDAFEVVGTANNGEEAIKQIDQLKPDIMTLDIEMPVMDGLSTLRALEKSPPAHMPQIVVFSAHSTQGAAITMEALNLGAADFVCKPTAKDGAGAIARELLPRLHALNMPPKADLAASKPQTSTPARSAPPLKRAISIGLTAGAGARSTQRMLLFIASSTGGPKALATALAPFPADFPVPIIIVQHMPPLFTRQLAATLDRQCQINVQEATQGLALQAGMALIAPGGKHLRLQTGENGLCVQLDNSPPLFGLRPAADFTIQSIKETLGSAVLACIFTGMGRDSADGLKELEGAAILTQSAESCTVYGMPAAVDEEGLSHGHFSPENFYDTVRSYRLHW